MERRPVLAITFALLMLASSVTMTGAAAAYGGSHNGLQPREQADAYPQFSAATSPISEHTANNSEGRTLPNVTDPHLGPHKRVAIANYTLHQIDGETGREERALSQARDEVASALERYEAGRPTDERAFHAKARAPHALARASGGSNDATIRDVSEGLFLASNESARVAVLDANGSLQAYSTDLDRNEQRFVERALRNAEGGFDRADRAAERGGEDRSLRRAVRAKADAIDHYRSAYHHAGRGMDRMERAVDSNLSLSQGQAFEQNDSVHVVLEARLTDVRPFAYDEASVSSVSDDVNASAIRFGRVLPGTSRASGTTIVDLGTEPENATVTVRANTSRDDRRQVSETINLSVDDVEVIPDPPAPDEYNEVEVHNESTGVTVRAGGDGVWEDRLSVTNETPDTEQDFRAGPVVRVESDSAIENGTVRIPIDESVPESTYEDLSVYTWNGSTPAEWKRVNTSIQNGTAVADVDHFSFFTIFNDLSWHEAITETVQTHQGAPEDPIEFEGTDGFRCAGACNVSNESTVVLGGTPDTQRIVVEQGNESHAVVPMSNGQRIGEFYDYGNSQINSPLPIFESDTSRLFFWAGPEGLSLVVLHDEPSDGSGGAVDLAFDGLQFDEGSWIVKDDPNDFDSGSRTRPAWTWNQRRTDGGVFRGGLTNSTIGITPYFNDEASNDPLTSGKLDEWQLLTGQATDPRTIGLSMDEPVSVRLPSSPSPNQTDVPDSGDSGTAQWTASLPEGADRIAVEYQIEQTDLDPGARLTATDESGDSLSHDLSIGTVGIVRETVNVSELDGNVNFTLTASGVNAQARVLLPEPNPDSDGDGIPDALEEREWTMPDTSFSTFSTDPHDPDTDGDGLEDGEEIEFVTTETEDGTEYRIQASSNPILKHSDTDGISDLQETEGWGGPVHRCPRSDA